MNTTGIEPTEFNVLVRLDEAPERIGSLIMPESKKERDENLMVKADLIAVSPHAFTYAEWDGIEHMKPKPGDKVRISKGAGSLFEDVDGTKYRLLKDKDIVAIIRDADQVRAVAA